MENLTQRISIRIATAAAALECGGLLLAMLHIKCLSQLGVLPDDSSGCGPGKMGNERCLMHGCWRGSKSFLFDMFRGGTMVGLVDSDYVSSVHRFYGLID